MWLSILGMEAAHPPIIQDGTAPLVPEKRESGTGTERGSIDTRTGTAHARTLTETRERGEAK